MVDVARVAGVSVASVSRALTQRDTVSPEIHERVAQAIKTLGYAMNGVARGLRRRSTGIVLVGVPNLGNPFFSRVLSGLEHASKQLSLSILIANTETDEGPSEDWARALNLQQADGLILLNGRPPHLAFPGMMPPTVLVSDLGQQGGHSSVSIDHEAAARMAIRHLLELGHQTIGHLAGPRDWWLTSERVRGVDETLAEAGLRGDVVHCDFSIEGGRRGARQLLSSRRRPTAIFASSDELALGAMSVCHELGLAVPADISVVGFDDLEIAAIYRPGLTTIHQPRFQLGESAMALLNEHLQQPDLPARHEKLPFELVQRDSTAPAKSASSGKKRKSV